MSRIVESIKKRWKWGVSIILLFSVLFAGYFMVKEQQSVKAADYAFLDSSGNEISSGGQMTMRRTMDTFSIKGIQATDKSYVWESLNTNIIEIQNADASGKWSGTSARLKAKTTGTVAIQVTVTHADDTTDVLNMSIDVVFSINEFLDGVSGVKLEKLYAADARKSLIMDYQSSVHIGNADSGNDHLKLVFGNGEDADWVSSNKDVIQYNSSTKVLTATGAGPATLTVTWTEGTQSYSDTINVYVRPQILAEDGTVLAGTSYALHTVEVKDGDKIKITVEDDANPQIGTGDKIVWVISKSAGSGSADTVLVRDSLGNHGQDWEEANLYYISSEKAYRIDAMAGEYTVQFYVKGTYKSFADSKIEQSKCDSVNLATKVDCEFTDKDVTLSLGGTYSLSEAFNIPLSVLKDNFTATIQGSGNTYVGIEETLMAVTTKSLGRAEISVKLNSGVATTEIPGFPSGRDTVTVTVTVADTFHLNIAETMIAVGAELDLHGIIGSDAVAEASQFKWTVSSEDYLELSKDEGQYITVKAKKETPSNKPATVTLAWTDTEGVTWVASCTITVTKAATSFSITEKDVKIEVNQTCTLHTDIDSKKANILWTSSDNSLVTVTANDGAVSAEVKASSKVGSAVITAVNKDNDTYATCVVTVTAPITDIKIDKGEKYTTTLASGFVFLKPVYQPSNATETTMKWSSSDETIATVDSTGTVTLLSEGTTRITVQPTNNPNGVWAWCDLTIAEDPITDIETDVTTLNMVKGDIYEVKTTITPENPSDPTLIWSVLQDKTDIVSVDQTGAITAVGVGTATVMVEGTAKTGKPAQAYIEVNVRDRLQKIEFESKNVEVPVKSSLQLNVLFTPSENVNKTLHFASADEELATVTDDGVVTGVQEGIVLITCWAEDIGKQNPIQCLVTVTKEVIPATGFEISPTNKTVMVGYSFNIEPIFTPENTSDQTVIYKSMNESVAKVDENGKVTGVKAGMTVITCTPVQNSGEIEAKSCTVTVVPAVKLRLSPSSREIAKGKSFQLHKIVTPETASTTATWKSSNSKIATVSSSGKVTGKALGSCTITCTLTKYGVSATCRVKVAKLRTTLKLNKTSIRMNIGSTYRLKKTVWTNNTKNPSVKFTSKNKRIASVGKTSGKIKARKIGSTYITAKTTDSIHATARCRVTVIRRITSLSLNKTYAICYVGRTTKLKATVKPKNATIKKLAWSSSNSKIARVTGSGKITGLAEGEAYITVKAKDGSNKKAKCFVKVLEPVPVTDILVAQSEITMKKGDRDKLSYTVLPSENSDSFKFASDNKRVVKVSSKGTVKAVGTGTANVTITSSSGVVTTVTVNVVSLNKTSLRIRQYDTEQLTVIGTSAPITWYSANNRIASVTNGKITGRGTGTTYVYAYVNGCKMGCRVKIVSVNTKKR